MIYTNNAKPSMRTTARIESGEVAAGWTYARLPGSKAAFGTGKAVKIEGTVDDVSIEATLMPDGSGDHMIPLRKAIMQSLAKRDGDEIAVEIALREIAK